ncbi:GNAT family N-acetyltransferase [Falsiroseomonas ponticola]|uniref:GNAT family N-acetyltransferase n=1 Tax=Falsiroseomonas ponticola TaxID=2786951 RepID=UPI001933C577|nr:GNAT family N-acetyltransferase [Roseomonas ponticola]
MFRPARPAPTEIGVPGGTALRIARVVQLPEGFAELAADAHASGERMLAVLREDWEAGTIRFDGWGEALFALQGPNGLVGLGGLTRDPFAGDDVVGRVRRFYIRRSARRAGAGRALLGAIVAAATEAGYPRLRVRAPASAFAFYEACGFLRAVREKGATHILPLGG